MNTKMTADERNWAIFSLVKRIDKNLEALMGNSEGFDILNHVVKIERIERHGQDEYFVVLRVKGDDELKRLLDCKYDFGGKDK